MRTENCSSALRLRRSMRCCISTAQPTAAEELVKTTISPSPTFLTSRPPVVSTAPRRIAKWSRRRLSAAPGPTRVASPVDPTRSVNRTVLVSSEPMGLNRPYALGARKASALSGTLSSMPRRGLGIGLPFLVMVAVAVSAVVASMGATAAPTGPAVANPTVSGPVHGGVHGYPWNKSLYKLKGKGFDYTENEYFYRGTAVDLSTSATAPYESRMLVRLPRNPRTFSGTILVEWLNVTGQLDLETAWPVEARYLMRHGIGYVGVSAQLAGVCCGPTTLKGWDPVRYAPLVHPSDQFSFDIFSQAIRALRGPKRIGSNPMRGMRARKVVVTGASQSALRLTNFVNGGYNRHQIDAYVITRGGGPFKTFSTPIFQLNEENNEIPQKDNRRYVAWQEAGTAHAPEQWWGYIAREQQRDGTAPPGPDAINSACSVNHGSVDYSARAMSNWV